ncbi:hypothetical protein Glove_117g301 [Diversispora epigaea]|uniref:Uncharacterized protein n=1 Tax=Diversispora epigaea TaxID=1348612 RepID=A0A397J016_9GLOM|nr:hypothetical protein Glove_117g301 [Diversispora epigaea]
MAANRRETGQRVYEKSQRFQTVATKKNSEIILGAISRKSTQKNKPNIIIQHYQQEIINGTERSPLLPCEGCHLKNVDTITKPNQQKENKEFQRCLIEIDSRQAKYVPVRKNIVSTSHKEDKRIKKRLIISPRSLKLYIDNTNEQQNTQQELLPQHSAHINIC